MEAKDISAQIAQVASGYHYHRPPDALFFLQDLLARFLRFLSDLLSSFHITIPGLVDSRLASDLMQIALCVCGAVATVVVLSTIVTRVMQLRDSGRQYGRATVSVTASLDADGWQKQADALAASGDYGGACRALYLCLINRLDERGIAAFVPARSNYEYWQGLSAHPEIQTRFKDVAQAVEGIWFGGRTARQQDYDDCLQDLQQVRQEIDSSAPPPAAPGSAT